MYRLDLKYPINSTAALNDSTKLYVITDSKKQVYLADNDWTSGRNGCVTLMAIIMVHHAPPLPEYQIAYWIELCWYARAALIATGLAYDYNGRLLWSADA